MEIGDKVINSYLDKKKEDITLGCHFAGGAILGKRTAKLVVGSSTPITLSTIKSFVFDNTEKKMVCVNNTFKVYDDPQKRLYYASIIAYKPVIKLNSNPSRLKQINSNSFLDEDLGTIWEKKMIEGKPYFFRENSDDIEEIFERVQYMTASTSARVGNIDSAFLPSFEGNLGAEFFIFNSKGEPGKAIGVIKGFTQDTCTITDKSGEITIPIHAVLSTIPIEGSYSTIEEVIAYLKKAYGKNYEGRLDEILKGRN